VCVCVFVQTALSEDVCISIIHQLDTKFPQFELDGLIDKLEEDDEEEYQAAPITSQDGSQFTFDASKASSNPFSF
jgi:hypothetical protein